MRDKGLQNFICAVLGLAIGALICLAVDCHAAPVPGDYERIKYATAFQKAFQANGYEVWTAVYGPEKANLLIVCKEFNNPEIVKNLIHDAIVQWDAFGFKEIMFTSGEATMFLDVKKALAIIQKKEAM